MKRRSLEDLQRICNEKGGKCLSLSFSGVNQKYLFVCKDGHEWYAWAHHVFSGSWCKRCFISSRRGFDRTEKVCSVCKQNKIASEFSRRSKNGNLSSACKLCASIALKEWRLENQEQYFEAGQRSIQKRKNKKRREPGLFYEQNRRHSLKVKYNISLEEYEQILVNQKFGCAICGVKHKNKYGLHVDHDHSTGKIRALLCSRHNVALGLIHDSPEEAVLLAKYLLLHKKDKNGKQL